MSATQTKLSVRRSVNDRLLLGVCAGVARTIDVSPLAVRLGVVAFCALAAPLALLAYIFVAMTVPREDGQMLFGNELADRRERRIGWLLVVVAGLMLVISGFDLSMLVWPSLSSGGLLIAGFAAATLIVYEQRKNGAEVSRPVVATQHSGVMAVAKADEGGTGVTHPMERSSTRVDETPADESKTTQVVKESRQRVGPSVGAIGVALLLVVFGLLFVLDVEGLFNVSAKGASIGLAVAAILAGVAAIFVAGRRGVWFLIVLGCGLALAALTVRYVDQQVGGFIGVQQVHPASIGEKPPVYRQGVGALDVDLVKTKLPAGTTTVRARVGLGTATFYVPKGVRVRSVGTTFVAGVEEANRFASDPRDERDRKTSRRSKSRSKSGKGSGSREKPKARPVDTSAQGVAKRRTVRLDVEVGAGSAEVIALDR